MSLHGSADVLRRRDATTAVGTRRCRRDGRGHELLGTSGAVGSPLVFRPIPFDGLAFIFTNSFTTRSRYLRRRLLDSGLACRTAASAGLSGSTRRSCATSNECAMPKPVSSPPGPQRASRKPSRRQGGLVVDAATSERLGRIRQHGTTAELEVRRILHRLGARFRVINRDLPGAPDVANRRGRWTIFVHGCFWHSHLGCVRATVPKRNRSFWASKFEANRIRDGRATRALQKLGFRTLVVWECELANPIQLKNRLSRYLSNEG